MKEYQTDQRRLLLDFFRVHRDCSLTIDEVMSALPASAAISRSSVYRNVDRMVREGLLSKSLASGGRGGSYRFAGCGQCCGRIHLRCEKCGRVFHMDRADDEALLVNTLGRSGFRLDEHATVLVGVCKNCN